MRKHRVSCEEDVCDEPKDNGGEKDSFKLRGLKVSSQSLNCFIERLVIMLMGAT